MAGPMNWYRVKKMGFPLLAGYNARSIDVSFIYNDVYWVANSTLTSKHIREEQRPVFNDNAFKERKEVYEKHQIPVFDVDAINSL